ncbi:MAG: single-stranded DNA-binding protein, partial [Bacilli bacterium]
FNRTASTVNKYCKKGTFISAIGRIKNGSYEKDGIKRYTTDVIVDQIELLSSKPTGTNSENNNYNSSDSNDNNYSSYTNNSSNVETTDISEDPYKNFGEQVALSSDDLPF